ncbi:hypothetical protein D9M69_656430 [compost metagenome]
MVRILRFIVLGKGSGPQLGIPQVFQVIQVIDDSPDVSAVAFVFIFPVNALFIHSRNDIIGRVSVRKPVGENQADGVFLAEACPVSTAVFSFQQGEVPGEYRISVFTEF